MYGIPRLLHNFRWRWFPVLQEFSQSLPPLAGFAEAGAVFLLLGARPAGPPSGPDHAGLPEGPGAPAARRGAEPHPQDGAGVRPAGRPGRAAAGGAGEESPTHQELGPCVCTISVGRVTHGAQTELECTG